MFRTVTVGTLPSAMVTEFPSGYVGGFHDQELLARFPVGGVSVTVQVVPAGMSGLVYGVFWVTEKEPVVPPQVQVPVKGVLPVPREAAGRALHLLDDLEVVAGEPVRDRAGRVVVVGQRQLVADRVPAVQDQPWEVYPSGEPASSRV